MTVRDSPIIPYAFVTRITPLATDTTLATATRHEFAAITVTIPETASRTFLSAWLEFTVRDAQVAVASDVDGVRMGIKVGAAAWVDTDLTIATANSGDHWWDMWRVDVTAAMAASFGAGTTASIQAAIAVATGTASSLSYVTCKLFISYSYDDASETTLQKAIRIPLQSHIANLTTSHVEFGTTAGVEDCASGQVPALATWLPEDSKVFYQAYLELHSNECTNVGSTDFTPYVQIDALAEQARALLENSLGTNLRWNDIIIWDTATLSTASTHTVKARSDLTNRMWAIGGELVVIYGYAKTSATVMCEAMVPFTTPGADHVVNEAGTAGPDATDADWMSAEFIVRESSPTLKQSAIYGIADVNSNGYLPRVWFGSRGERVHAGQVSAQGQGLIMVRIDHGTGPATLVQGSNAFVFKSYSANTSRGTLRGYVLFNYTATSPSSGPHTVTMPRAALLQASPSAASVLGDVTKAPIVISGDYALASVFVDVACRSTTFLLFMFAGEAGGSEWRGGGFVGPAHQSQTGGNTERITRTTIAQLTQIFDPTSQHTASLLNIETSRRWRWSVNVTGEMSAVFWACYSSFTYTISGTISGYTGDGSGITVELFDPDDKKIRSTTTAVGGGYTFTTLDNRAGYWTQARQSSTLMGRSDDITPS